MRQAEPTLLAQVPVQPEPAPRVLAPVQLEPALPERAPVRLEPVLPEQVRAHRVGLILPGPVQAAEPVTARPALVQGHRLPQRVAQAMVQPEPARPVMVPVQRVPPPPGQQQEPTVETAPVARLQVGLAVRVLRARQVPVEPQPAVLAEQGLVAQWRLTTVELAVQAQLEPVVQAERVLVVQQQPITAVLVQLAQPGQALVEQEQVAVQPRVVLAELRQPAERVTAVQATVQPVVRAAQAAQVEPVVLVEPVAA